MLKLSYFIYNKFTYGQSKKVMERVLMMSTFLNLEIMSPCGENTVLVLYSFPSEHLSGMEPPTKYVHVSLATSDSICVASPGISSAYSAKYFVPYGELKHSWIKTNLSLKLQMECYWSDTNLVDLQNTINAWVNLKWLLQTDIRKKNL